MTVPKEVETEIRRLHDAERWPLGTIAAQLSLHEDVVRRVLGLLEPAKPKAPRIFLVDPFKDFIAETLQAYPRLCASRLFDMICGRGYRGSDRTLRTYVAKVRPHPPREVFLRVEPLIGEQGQIDWMHVAKVKVPGGERSLWAFVMVLAYSRAMWGELVFDMTAYSLIRSLVRACEYFGAMAPPPAFIPCSSSSLAITALNCASVPCEKPTKKDASSGPTGFYATDSSPGEM